MMQASGSCVLAQLTDFGCLNDDSVADGLLDVTGFRNDQIINYRFSHL